MKILHYSLGLPPYRSGGLTKYCTDLMIEQIKQNNDVFLLFPGYINDAESKVSYYDNYSGINVYELVNPLPVPLLNGTLEPTKYMGKCNKEIFINFLEKIDIEVVHVHTLMGLYKEFLDACKEIGIKIVYTSHDYFGICTKVNFLGSDGKICSNRDIEKCIICNSNADGMKKIKVLQSRSYRWLKNKGVVAMIKIKVIKIKKNNNTENKANVNSEVKHTNINKDEYEKLIQYYKGIFSCMDNILYNSEVAKNIYEEYLNVKGDIIPITHADIKDNRVIKKYDNEILRLAYLGPNEKYKGYDLISEVMETLDVKFGENITLDIFGQINSSNTTVGNNVKINGSYKYSDLENIFSKIDILIVPSICNETFGFITLEALSYGVPVMVTNKVGSKYLLDVEDKAKGIIVGENKDEVLSAIAMVYKNRNLLKEWNENILNDEFELLISNHCKCIVNAYRL